MRVVRELAAELGTLRAGEAVVTEAIEHHLVALLGLECMLVYRLVEGRDGLALDVLRRRMDDAILRDFRALVARSNNRFGYFDPRRPDRAQQNRALRSTDLQRFGPMSNDLATIYAKNGLDRLDQLRVLACEGDALLAWVGGFREAPFSTRERKLLADLVPDWLRRLTIFEHVRRAALHDATLHVALEAIGAPAFVVDDRGAFVLANQSGLAELERDRRSVRDNVARAIAQTQRRANLPSPLFAISEIEARGEKRHYLAVARTLPAEDASIRALRARKRWGLTPRQAEVLVHVASGLSNRAIAVAMGIAEGTAELHVSAVLEAAGAESRAQLVARFWREL